MKIIVISDTHGNSAAIFHLLDSTGNIDAVIHLGDETGDTEHLELATTATIFRIAGNCDAASTFPRELTLELGGKRFFLTHGDRYGVKTTLENLRRKAAVERADVVLYGHTHLAAINELDGRLYVNPGCLKRGCTSPGYALLTLDGLALSAELVPLPA